METVCSWGCPLELLLRGAFRHLAVSRAIRANERLKGAQRAMIGIIGGTGLYAMQELQTPRAHTVSTPFGAPSAPLMTGMLRGREVVFLPRHGLEHQLLPGEINFRANIWALKNLGVRTVIGVSAVGSLRAEIHPRELALPSQYLDFTPGTRAARFFGAGPVPPIPLAQAARPATATLVPRVAHPGGVALHEDKNH